jgi:hypothetical protein
MGLFDSFFKGKTSTVSQTPMTTAEQDAARKALLAYGQGTGGSGYDFSGFDFGPTGTENTGLNLLNQNLMAGQSAGMGTAQDVLSGMATQTFNPDDPGNAFAAFQRQLSRATQNSADQLNREAAITGSRFGTQIARQKADLGERQADITANKMGDMWSQTQGNKLAAAQGLGQLQAMQEQINQSRIAQAFQLGGLQRELKNQQAQLKYGDYMDTKNDRLNALTGVMGNNVQWGIKDYTTKTASPFSSLLNQALTVGGQALGTAVAGPLGGMIGGSIGGLFGKSAGGGSTSSYPSAGSYQPLSSFV